MATEVAEPTQEQNALEQLASDLDIKEPTDSFAQLEEMQKASETPAEEAKEPVVEQPEAPAEETVEEPAEQAPPEVVFDEKLLAHAEKLGWSADEVKATFNTPDALIKAFGMLGKPAQQETPKEPQKTIPAEKPADAPAPEADDFKFELDPDVEPSIQKAFSGLHDHYRKQNGALRFQVTELTGVVSELVKFTRSELQTRMESQFHEGVQALGEEYAEIVGKGRFSQLDPGSDHYKAQERIAKEVIRLKAGYESMGDTAPSIPELVKRAAASVFADKQPKIARQQIAKQLDKQKGGHGHRPSQRNSTAELPAVKRAELALAEAFKANGWTNPESSDGDGLL